MERASPRPGTLSVADWAHSLSCLKDCSLIKNTPFNLISRLLLSQMVKVHLKWLKKLHWHRRGSCFVEE